MAVFVALLRAVNVGGTGRLPMGDLQQLCEDAGFQGVRTYIQSGNVVFSARLAAGKVRKALESALEKKMGRPVGVHLRTPPELESILERNPFEAAPPNRVLVFFLDRAAPKEDLARLKVPGREKVVPSGREVFVHYPDGLGRSKLKLPFARGATARNVNTVRKLLELSRDR